MTLLDPAGEIVVAGLRVDVTALGPRDAGVLVAVPAASTLGEINAVITILATGPLLGLIERRNQTSAIRRTKQPWTHASM